MGGEVTKLPRVVGLAEKNGCTADFELELELAIALAGARFLAGGG